MSAGEPREDASREQAVIAAFDKINNTDMRVVLAAANLMVTEAKMEAESAYRRGLLRAAEIMERDIRPRHIGEAAARALRLEAGRAITCEANTPTTNDK